MHDLSLIPWTQCAIPKRSDTYMVCNTSRPTGKGNLLLRGTVNSPSLYNQVLSRFICQIQMNRAWSAIQSLINRCYQLNSEYNGHPWIDPNRALSGIDPGTPCTRRENQTSVPRAPRCHAPTPVNFTKIKIFTHKWGSFCCAAYSCVMVLPLSCVAYCHSFTQKCVDVSHLQVHKYSFRNKINKHMDKWTVRGAPYAVLFCCVGLS